MPKIMKAIERHRQTWQGKSDEWLFERLDNELKQKVEEIRRLLAENEELKRRIYKLEVEMLANKNFVQSDVRRLLACDRCGCHPNTLFNTDRGRFCIICKPAS